MTGEWRTDERGAPPAASVDAPVASAPEQLEIVVVDDDDASRVALCGALILLGYRCRSAASAVEALEAHAERPSDIIVSDWQMPGIDGMELCRRVRSLDRGRYTYLLFVSAHARKRDFVEAVRAGADDYLPKPIDLEDLEARLIAGSRVVEAYRRLADRNVALRHDSQMFFRAARIDALTQVANRLKLEEDLEALQAQVFRYHRRVTVAMCDLDSFKHYNDSHGHLAGDQALQRVAQTIRHSLRRADQVYRYGGEEFLVLLPEQTPADVAVALERVRSAVEGLGFVHGPGTRHPVLTVSIGVAAVAPTGENCVRSAIAFADEALYRAKASGGNRVGDAYRFQQ